MLFYQVLTHFIPNDVHQELVFSSHLHLAFPADQIHNCMTAPSNTLCFGGCPAAGMLFDRCRALLPNRESIQHSKMAAVDKAAQFH